MADRLGRGVEVCTSSSIAEHTYNVMPVYIPLNPLNIPHRLERRSGRR